MEIVFKTEKEYQEFVDRIQGKFTPERNKQLQATRERMKKLRGKELNLVSNKP